MMWNVRVAAYLLSFVPSTNIKKYTGSYRLSLLKRKIVRHCTEYATFVYGVSKIFYSARKDALN